MKDKTVYVDVLSDTQGFDVPFYQVRSSNGLRTNNSFTLPASVERLVNGTKIHNNPTTTPTHYTFPLAIVSYEGE